MGEIDKIITPLKAYALGLFYSILIVFDIFVRWIKNPFVNPWQQKLRLEPPALLNDPKYGVHQYAKVNDVKLHYVESGDSSKPLMILVHGFPEFWYSWRHQIVEFNKKYWVVAVDLRGFGDSEKLEGISSYKVDKVVKDLRELLKHLGREKCIMIGHDWGSLVTCEFRNTHPECLLAVITAAGGCISGFSRAIKELPTQKKKSWYTFFFQMPWLPELIVTRYDLMMIENMMKRSEWVTDKDIECYKYIYGKPDASTGPINYYRANIHKYVPDFKVKEENVPFIHGAPDKDPYIGVDSLKYLKEEYKHLETQILKDCGHFVQQDNPEVFNKFVKEFLAKHNL